MKKVRIIGAGFSGLSLAWACSRLSMDVEVWEKDRIGGLIATNHLPEGAAEQAANGILHTAELDELCNDLGLIPLKPTRRARARWIFHKGKFRKWPLSWKGNLELARGLFFYLCGGKKIKPGELVSEFLDRTFGPVFRTRLAEPALQGIYGGSIDELSANLVLGPTWRRENRGARAKGTVSFAGGMGSLTQKMHEVLAARGVRFVNRELTQIPTQKEVSHVFCGSLRAATKLMKESGNQFFSELERLQMRGISTATVFFREEEIIPNGFGVLFPKEEGAPALGVLFNHCLFSDRAKVGLRSETWIIDSAKISRPEDLVREIESFRQEKWGSRETSVQSQVVSWAEGLPVYNRNLESLLRGNDFFEPLQINGTSIYLHGNYLGGIGLSRILTRSKQLALILERKTYA